MSLDSPIQTTAPETSLLGQAISVLRRLRIDAKNGNQYAQQVLDEEIEA